MSESLFEEAPCGHISARLDGTILTVNRTFEAWTGLAREDLVGRRRFQDLLTPGGRIYHETHYAPLLRLQGSVRAIALEIVRADGSRMPALLNSVLRPDAHGRPQEIWTSVFDATDRREYENELLRASRREHDAAHRLQRSLLAGALPTPAGCELEVVYRAAVSGTEAGGDWYDAFWLDDDGEMIGMVVGDVVGRGIDAAATMGQLRSAVRALASTGLAPGPLLTHLDRFARRHAVGKMCTTLYAQLGLGSGQLRFASAGHPPPLVAPPGEEPRFAWGGRSTPLDAIRSDRPREESSEALPPGSLVLLYTDGLVERRSEPLDEGMERLRGVVAGSSAEPLPGLLDRLIREVPDLEHADDICALAFRLA